jgi:hypothetical protein
MNDDTAKPDAETGDEMSRRFAEKLAQDVRVWAANEDQASDRAEDAAQQLAARQIKASSEAARKRSAAKAKAATDKKPAARKPGPYAMSYDGQTLASHLAARRALGAR